MKEGVVLVPATLHPEPPCLHPYVYQTGAYASSFIAADPAHKIRPLALMLTAVVLLRRLYEAVASLAD
jgi:hypothetical protein